MYKPALVAGALFGCLAVILGAFGAHALKEIIPVDQQQVFETAVRYQFYHSFALLATGVIYGSFSNKLLRLASSFFMSGTILFSGSLYLMIFLSTRGGSLGPAGVITPIGGLALILGWIYLIVGIVKKQ